MAKVTQPLIKPLKSILVSQPTPPETPKSPYYELAEKFNIKIEFRQFIKVEGVGSKEFRKQRINILDYSAIIFTSRNAIDFFFKLCEDLRIRMPEMTKYFCVTESIAVYLQKYIQYRKRKVFFGPGKESELFEVINKHIQNEKILFPCTNNHKNIITDHLRAKNANYAEAIMYQTVPADLSDMKGKISHDMIVLFTPTGVQSLFKNFENFKQGTMRIGAMGAATIKAMEDHNLRVDVCAPTPEAPSIIMALEKYLSISNKKQKTNK